MERAKWASLDNQINDGDLKPLQHIKGKNYTEIVHTQIKLFVFHIL